MNKSIWTIAGGTAVLCAALIAAPAYTSASRQQEQEAHRA